MSLKNEGSVYGLRQLALINKRIIMTNYSHKNTFIFNPLSSQEELKLHNHITVNTVLILYVYFRYYCICEVRHVFKASRGD